MYRPLLKISYQAPSALPVLKYYSPARPETRFRVHTARMPTALLYVNSIGSEGCK